MPDNPIILDIQGEDGFTLDMQDSDGLDFEAQPFSKGDPGKSAYQVAVDNGFSGTEDEWLASLVGPEGPPGTTDWDGITNKPYLPWEQGVDANDQPVPGAIKSKDFTYDGTTFTNTAPYRGAFVAGGGNTATGSYAVIAGLNNTANASSTTIGYNNTAAGGGGSTLLGNSNQATSGTWGFAAGVGNTISHNNTTAMGWYNTASNYNALAVGKMNTASGNCSVALGCQNTSSGLSSFAEGYQTTASASGAHSEGRSTTASGQCAHAEGWEAEASGYQAHAEGHGTQATARYNHVFGEYNISDPGFTAANARGTYVEIVGNGDDAQNRSNARTLDWNGNEVLAGTLTVGSDPTSNMDVATKQYVDNATSNIPTKTSDLTNDSGFITSESDPVFTASAAHGITSSDITAWNNKSDFSGSYNDLTDVPASFTPSAHSHNLSDVTDVTASASEVNILDGATIPTADLNQAYQGIPYGNVTSNSTTVFTATVPGVTALKDGTCCLIRNNNKQTSASGWTLNVNDLGAKPVYNNMADASRETTIFNKAYTMLFVYDEDRVDGGCWICYRGYNSDNNTIGYQLRTNSTVMNVSDTARYYKLYFTSADNTMWVPASVNSTNNATAARPVNQRPINPFGRIVYTSANTNYTAGSNLAATTIWDQYALSLGYSFNRTGAALTMTVEAPVYVKCAPQSDGSAIMDATTPIVQALPSTADGKIYIYLGVAYSATNIELVYHHPVYYHDGTAIRLWTGASGGSSSVAWNDITGKPTFATVATSGSYNDLSNKPTIPTVPTNVSAFTNDAGYLTSAPVTSVNGQTGAVTGLQTTSNLVTSISSSSTDTQYPSAKCVYDVINTAIGTAIGGSY